MSRLLEAEFTAAVIIGAHDWSECGLGLAPSFRRSSRRLLKYLYAESGLGLDPDLVLDLFDDPSSAADQLARIRETLNSRLRERRDEGRPVTDLLLYYIGHGHPDDEGSLSLLVRRTRKGQETEGGIRTSDLARNLRLAAPHQRRILCIDCCYSEQAVKAFIGMSSDLNIQTASMAMDALTRDQPKRGTLVFCSSPAQKASIGIPDAEATLFTGAVLDTLVNGVPEKGASLSFSELRDFAYDLMVDRFGSEAPRPALHQANQEAGDLLRIPAFFNGQEKAREAAKAKRQAEQARMTAEAERRAKEARETKLAERRAGDAREPADAKRRAQQARETAEAERRIREARETADAKRRAEQARETAEADRRTRETREAEEAERRTREARETADAKRRAEQARETAEAERRIQAAEEAERRTREAEQAERRASEAREAFRPILYRVIDRLSKVRQKGAIVAILFISVSISLLIMIASHQNPSELVISPHPTFTSCRWSTHPPADGAIYFRPATGDSLEAIREMVTLKITDKTGFFSINLPIDTKISQDANGVANFVYHLGMQAKDAIAVTLYFQNQEQFVCSSTY